MFLTRILKRGAKPAFEPERELATFSPFRSASPLKFDSQAVSSMVLVCPYFRST